jgi:hypothetical protein
MRRRVANDGNNFFLPAMNHPSPGETTLSYTVVAS